MLNYLAARNLRSFGRQQEIEIRPLTVVMGKNSSGKSSLIRAMFLLRQTAEARDRLATATFEGEYAQFGSFLDFAHRHVPTTEVSVGWGFSPPRPRPQRPIPHRLTIPRVSPPERIRRPPLSDALTSLRLDASFTYNRRSTEVRSESVSLKAGVRSLVADDLPEFNLLLERNRIDNVWSKLTYTLPELDYSGSYRMRRTGQFYDLSIGWYHGHERRSGQYDQMTVRRIATSLASYIERQAEKLILLGPIRAEAQRFYLLTGARPQGVGMSGEKSVEVLWMARRSRLPLTDAVSKWLKRFDISLEIRLRRVARTSFLAVELVDPRSGVTVQLADVGVGASQVLPILVGGFMSEAESTLVIEQPELHLHPSAQADMADALIEMMRADRTIVIETHSEHLVRRIQRRIADSTLRESEVALYYVDRVRGNSSVFPVGLDHGGGFLDDLLPDGFFDVDYKETIAITSARRKSRRGAD